MARLVLLPRTEKTCSACQEVKPLADFPPSKKGDRDGLDSRCRPCKARLRREAQAAKTAEERSVEARRANLWQAYKITVEEYDAKLAAQGGVCAICHEGPKHFKAGKLLPLCVDHDHKTGQNRDLLCGPCNALVGMAQEDQDRLLSAMAYVSKWGVL